MDHITATAFRFDVATGERVTVTVQAGDTVYYKNASDVSSSSNDGSIAGFASKGFSSPGPQWLACAAGGTANVLIGRQSAAADDPAFNLGGEIMGGQGMPFATYSALTVVDNKAYFVRHLVKRNFTVRGLAVLVDTAGLDDELSLALLNPNGTRITASGAVVGALDNVGVFVQTINPVPLAAGQLIYGALSALKVSGAPKLGMIDYGKDQAATIFGAASPLALYGHKSNAHPVPSTLTAGDIVGLDPGVHAVPIIALLE